MAKQTFTTGQVLTAAQMTSLQQTAMLGGSASAKVASYTLVAADAGTTVSMSNAGATTITVNTGLFAAGDIVTILNTGAGTCTITAGTATVSKPTNATLALVTNAGGVLYFTATGAATFLPFDVGSGSTSPLTTKGDLFGYDTANARIPIGTNNQVLTADSTQALGLKWATPSTGGTWTSFTPTFTQGASVSTSTTAGSFYSTVGNITYVIGKATFSSAGTANNMIIMTNPPVAPIASSYLISGTVKVYDQSANLIYMGFCEVDPSGIYFSSGIASAASTYYWGMTGSQFAIALASSDTINFSLMYRS